MKAKNPKPSTLLKKSLALLGPKGEKWIQDEEEISPGDTDQNDEKTYPEGAFCSIGAIHHVNTNNEDKAAAYLAFAIRFYTNDFNREESWTDTSIITNANDDVRTNFTKVKRWFTKAIQMAKKNGD